MILEEETFKKYEYYPSKLKPQSAKPILAGCDDCGKVRTTSKHDYYTLCRSCVRKGEKCYMFGKHPTESTKALLSATRKGKHHTKETKALMSEA